MDVNYTRWMSKDPDEPDVVEEEPRRFNVRWPSRSAVASAGMASLIVLGGAAAVRSLATPDATTDQAQSVRTPDAGVTAEPTVEPTDAFAEDTPNEEVTDGNQAPIDPPRRVIRGELRRPSDLPPGAPQGEDPPRVHVHHGPVGVPGPLVVRR